MDHKYQSLQRLHHARLIKTSRSQRSKLGAYRTCEYSFSESVGALILPRLSKAIKGFYLMARHDCGAEARWAHQRGAARPSRGSACLRRGRRFARSGRLLNR